MSTAKTTPQSAADFWSLVARSGLHAPAHVAALRAAFEASAAGRAVDAAAAASWIVSQRQLTGWQARRLLRGDVGPFTIGDYRLLERLDSPVGAMLLRALHVPSGRSVVVAVLDRRRCRDLEAWTTIVRRTATAHHMADPTFSKTWALEQIDGSRFIVCEDVVGPTLLVEVAKRGGLPLQEAGWATLSLARAVAEHHRSCGVHGAISLDSLRRDPQSGGLRLLQYPLVGDPHATPPRVPLENREAVSKMGTQVAFLAPECILSGGTLDEACDIYAIGCVLASLVTGSVPGWKGSAEATLTHAATVGFDPPGPPEVPPEVGMLVGYLAARDPAQRYPTAADAATAIAACFGFPDVAAPDPAQVAPDQPWSEGGDFFVATPQPDPSPPPVIKIDVTTDEAPAAAPTPPPPGRSGDATLQARRRVAIFRAAVGGIAAAFLAGVVIFAFRGQQDETRPAANRPAAKQTTGETEPPDRDAPAEQPRNDGNTKDGTKESGTKENGIVRLAASGALWDAPTHAGPPSLDFAPPGSRVMLLVRPADMLATSEGARFLQALGPAAEAAIRDAAAICGCEPSGIERILAGWQVDEKGAAVAGFAFELAEPIDAENPPAAWKSTKHLAMALPKSRGGRLLVAAPPDLLALMLETEGAPQLTADMQRLAERLDASRHIVVIGSPAFLENDGRDMLSGPLGRLAEPVARFFGAGVRGAAFSIHFGETSSYAELLAMPPRDVQPPALSAALARNVASLPDTVEEYVASLDLHPYGRKLVARLPGMVRALEANLRRGTEDSIAVVNCHLPPTAPHNLALAAEIALEQRPGRAAATTAEAGQGGGKGAAEALARKISLAFPRDSLDRTLQTISEEIGVPFEILGSDLRLKGITQNQSFSLDEREQTVDSILRTILLKANPDGHLVYVIRKKDGVESIVITTREACENRGEAIPEVFRKRP